LSSSAPSHHSTTKPGRRRNKSTPCGVASAVNTCVRCPASMVRCLTCDKLNEPGALACKHCNTGIASVCVQCGAGNPVLARFSAAGGGRLEAPRDNGAPGLPRPGRRQVRVLFSDLVGSTQLSRVLDPEDWHELVNRLHSSCSAVIAEHRGHVAQYLGDG